MTPIIHNLTTICPSPLNDGEHYEQRMALDRALAGFNEERFMLDVFLMLVRRGDDPMPESTNWYYHEELDGEAAVGRWSLPLRTEAYSRKGAVVLSLAIHALQTSTTLTMRFREDGKVEPWDVTVIECASDSMEQIDAHSGQLQELLAKSFDRVLAVRRGQAA